MIKHAATIIISVAVSYAVITPSVQYRSDQVLTRLVKCEQMLLARKFEPMCAGIMEAMGYDVNALAALYSGSPYDAKQASEKALAQTREIGVKP